MIPRILHRTVPAETSEQIERWWDGFREHHATWDLRTHRDPLDPYAWPLTSPHWDRCSSGAQRAGLIRLEALYRSGGIYVDSDVECYRPLDSLVGLSAFAGWEDASTIPDAVLGAEPEHPAIAECLALAIQELEHGAWASGPGVTTLILARHPDVTLLPPGAFYPYHYSEKHRRTDDLRVEQPWAYLAHHWAGSWLT